jgi:TatD DNase family protein
MLIDTHCHLAAADFAADRDAVAAAARAAGVASGNRRPGGRCGELRRGARLLHASCRLCPRLRYPSALRPAGRRDRSDALRGWLQRAAAGPERPVAVGEIGLDFFVADPDVERQERFFVEQLKIARACRSAGALARPPLGRSGAQDLRRITVRGGIAHAFNGSRQQAEEFIKLGFRLGFRRCADLQRIDAHPPAGRSLPLASIVLETDAPDMPPAWLAGGRNTPLQLPRINAVLAELRGIDASELARATAANALAVLPRLRSPD